ncbi:hypothetical protein QFC22_005969 [Naganishia vaughanmartiniae]|uniref:Uncharacterized protein n=1 Tax=Naganishia vaughanmartiniae TaxID=1424756 RepID=A0ACC2WQT5_9TREE|nr:hypothetical protein QFC22_005969 [Naganishia vaughanmartiniae]
MSRYIRMRTGNISVFKWERQWVAPAGLPQGSAYKVLKWVKTSEKVRPRLRVPPLHTSLTVSSTRRKKARFISLSSLTDGNNTNTNNTTNENNTTGNNAQEEAEDVDMMDLMDAENDNENENEEGDDDEPVVVVSKPSAEEGELKAEDKTEVVDLEADVDVDVSMDQQDESQPPSAARIEEQAPSSASAVDVGDEQLQSQPVTIMEDTADVQSSIVVRGEQNVEELQMEVDIPSTQEISAPMEKEKEQGPEKAGALLQDVSETPEPTSAEVSALPAATSPVQPNEKVASEDIISPAVVISTPTHAEEQGVMQADMEIQQQQLDRPEDSMDALALPVESAVPLPEDASNTENMENAEQGVGDCQAGYDVSPAVEAETVTTEPEGTQPTTITADSSLPVDNSTQSQSASASATSTPHHAERSRTPSPTPARIQEFQQSTSDRAHEPALVVPGNLSSPSPQPEPQPHQEAQIASTGVPSNAVQGSVAGGHVGDVQLGGAAAGTVAGEITLEVSHGTSAGAVAEAEAEREMMTMEGETDPGVPLGEGDPVGVNGEEEFADVDIRRAGAVAEAEGGAEILAKEMDVENTEQ